jgi:hypothetical protein
LRCGVAVDEEDDACGTGEDGYEVAGYVLFGDFDGPVVRCLRFRHDDTVPYACDSARFDGECVAVVGNDTNPVGTFSNRNPGSLLGGAAIRIGSDRNEITGRGKYLETSAVVDGHIRNRWSDFHCFCCSVKASWVKQRDLARRELGDKGTTAGDSYLDFGGGELHRGPEGAGDGVDGDDGAVGLVVYNGVCAAVLFDGVFGAAQLAGVDGGDDLFGEWVVLNELLIDRVSDKHVAVGYIQAMSTYSSASQDRNRHTGNDHEYGDEFWEFYLEALPSQSFADEVGTPGKGCFSSCWYISWTHVIPPNLFRCTQYLLFGRHEGNEKVYKSAHTKATSWVSNQQCPNGWGVTILLQTRRSFLKCA